jgi:hypothetical protein
MLAGGLNQPRFLTRHVTACVSGDKSYGLQSALRRPATENVQFPRPSAIHLDTKHGALKLWPICVGLSRAIGCEATSRDHG